MGMQKVRSRQRGTRQRTLDVEHSSTVAKLHAAHKALDDKMAKYNEIVKRAREMEMLPRAALSDAELDELMMLKDTVRAMELEVDQARAACDEVEYYLKAGDILFKYYDIIDKGGTIAHQNHDDADAASSTSNQQSAATTHDAVSLSKPSAGGLPANSIMRFFSHSSGITTTEDCSSSSSANVQQEDAVCGTGQALQSALATKKQRYGSSRHHHHHHHPHLHKNRTNTDDRATLLEKYLTCTNTDFIKSDAPEDEAAIENAAASVPTPCAHCGSTNRTVMTHDGYIFCNECFTLEYVLVDHEKPSYKDPPKEVTYFAYKRINHFNEWLNQVQGKETTDIPDEVYDKILLEIKKQKISNMADLTHVKVREILKKLKINKYYEHIPHIINRLSGVSMPHIPPELEDRLRHMFCQIQVPFLKHSPPSRKNFLSYSYVLHKFMQLLEKDQYVHCFTLLKSRDKLQAQDIIWSKICEELGWEFVRSL